MEQRLWAGWRMKYIVSEKSRKCLFCTKSKQKPNPKNLVLLLTRRSLIMLNAFPYNCGHLMVAPRRHVSSFSGLTEEESLELMKLLSVSENLLKRVYRADGLNVGLNLGKSAGAGVPGHLHVHVVPRWCGDTNFMTTVSSTKVLPEALADSYRRLKSGLDKMGFHSGHGLERVGHGSKAKRVR